MLKKVVKYIMFGLCIAAFGAYIWFCGTLHTTGSAQEICADISVTIKDSLSNRLVSSTSVREMITRIANPIGKPVSDIDVRLLEQEMKDMGAILYSDVAVDRTGTVFVEVTQRHPVLRFQSGADGYYMDDTGFCFPLSDLFTSDVPVVSGIIPAENPKWRKGMRELGQYLDKDPFWRTQVEQINVNSDGGLTIYTRTSDQAILFGMPRDIDSKLSKLFTYYKNIAPVYGWDYYSTVNLKYSGQIVCIPAKKDKK